jgi:hypothetical protein
MTRNRWMFAALLVVFATAAVEWSMGRPPICACGTVEFWGPVGPKQSQMLADWYSPSHIIHGFLFYAVAWWLWPRWSLAARFALSTAVEAGWELVENTPTVIDRYREATMALGYTGDTIINSMSDIAMMGIGFWLARKVPIWVSVVAVVALELAALAAVRDNLTLNVWMLLWPNEAILRWQASG